MFNIFTKLADVFENNQFLITIFGLSGAGLLTFWTKDIPLRILNFIKLKAVTVFIIEPKTHIAKIIPSWLEENFLGLTKYDSYALTSFSYSTHSLVPHGKKIVRYKNKYILISITIRDSDLSFDNSKTQSSIAMTIKYFGKDIKYINMIIEEIKDYAYRIYERDDTAPNMLYVTDKHGCVYSKGELPNRTLDTLFMNNDNKIKLINTIDYFINNKDVYDTMGLPYKLGILLHGPPGTGKSSLIKAICNKYKKDAIVVSPSELGALLKIDYSMIEHGIIIVEDIDNNNIIKPRTDTDNNNNTSKGVGLSDILNIMDGLSTMSKLMFIFTTNHLERLDPALFRPGRIDLLLELGYMDNNILRQLLDYYYPNHNINLNNFKLKDNLTVAMIQHFIINKQPVEHILEFCSDKSISIKEVI